MSRLTLLAAQLSSSEPDLQIVFNEWATAGLADAVGLIDLDYYGQGLDLPVQWNRRGQYDVTSLRELLTLERYSAVTMVSIRSRQLRELTSDRLAGEVTLLGLIKSRFGDSRVPKAKSVKAITVAIADPDDLCDDRHFDPRWDLHILHDPQLVSDSSVAVIPLETEDRTTVCLLTALAVSGALILPDSGPIAMIDQLADQPVGLTKPIRLVRVQLRSLDAGFYTDQVMKGIFLKGHRWSVPAELDATEANPGSSIPSNVIDQLIDFAKFEYIPHSSINAADDIKRFKSPISILQNIGSGFSGRLKMLRPRRATLTPNISRTSPGFRGSDSQIQTSFPTAANPQAWNALKTTAFGLLDGSRLSSGLQVHSNTDRFVYTDPNMIGPPPDDAGFEIPDKAIADLGFNETIRVEPMDVAMAEEVDAALLQASSPVENQDEPASLNLPQRQSIHDLGQISNMENREASQIDSSRLERLQEDWDQWSAKRDKSFLWRIRQRLVGGVNEASSDLIDSAADIAVGERVFSSDKELRSTGTGLQKKVGWLIQAGLLTIALLVSRIVAVVSNSVSSIFWLDLTPASLNVESEFWYILASFVIVLILADHLSVFVYNYDSRQENHYFRLQLRTQAKKRLKPLIDDYSRLFQRVFIIHQELESDDLGVDNQELTTELKSIQTNLRRLGAWLISLLLLMVALMIIWVLLAAVSDVSGTHEARWVTYIAVGILSWLFIFWITISLWRTLKQDFLQSTQATHSTHDLVSDLIRRDEREVDLNEIRRRTRRLTGWSIILFLLMASLFAIWNITAVDYGASETQEEPWVVYLVASGIVFWLTVCWFLISRWFALRETFPNFIQISFRRTESSDLSRYDHRLNNEIEVINERLRRLASWLLILILVMVAILVFWIFTATTSSSSNTQEEPWVLYTIFLGILFWFIVCRHIVSRLFAMREKYFPLLESTRSINHGIGTNKTSTADRVLDADYKRIHNRLRRLLGFWIALVLLMILLVAFWILTTMASYDVGIREEPQVGFIVIWIIACSLIACRFIVTELLTLKDDIPRLVQSIRAYRDAIKAEDVGDHDKQFLSVRRTVQRRLLKMAGWSLALFLLIAFLLAFWIFEVIIGRSFVDKEATWMTYIFIWTIACALIICWLTASRLSILKKQHNPNSKAQYSGVYGGDNAIRKFQHSARERDRLINIDHQFDDWQAIIRTMVHEPFLFADHTITDDVQSMGHDLELSSVGWRPRSFVHAISTPQANQLKIAQDMIRNEIIRTGWLSGVFNALRDQWENDYLSGGERRRFILENDNSPPGTIRGRSIVGNQPVYAPREDFRRWILSDRSSRVLISSKLLSEAFEEILEKIDLDTLLSEVTVVGPGQGLNGIPPQEFLSGLTTPLEEVPLFSLSLFSSASKAVPLRIHNVALSFPEVVGSGDTTKMVFRSPLEPGTPLRFASLRILVSEALNPNLLSYYSKFPGPISNQPFDSPESIV